MAKKTITERTTTTKKIYIYPCIKCECDNVDIYNCGYSSFNCAGGKCKKCGHKIETGADWDAKDSDLIKAWNRGNNPDVLIDELLLDKQAISDEIKRLRKIKRRLKNAVQQ